jgi:hypothetical protein
MGDDNGQIHPAKVDEKDKGEGDKGGSSETQEQFEIAV